MIPDSGVSLFADPILHQKMAPLLGPFLKNAIGKLAAELGHEHEKAMPRKRLEALTDEDVYSI